MKKIFCILLAMLMLVSVTACNKRAEEADTTETGEAQTDAAIWEKFDGKTFSGETYDILSRASSAYEVAGAEEGELVSSAVYQRNLEMSEKFDVEIKVHEEAGDFNVKTDFIAKVESAFMGGTHAYDLVMTHSGYVSVLALRGFAYDLEKLPYVDLEKEWWCQGYIENADVDGRKFLAMGDIGYSIYEYMECVFFNKTLTENYELPDLYTIANNGDWTFDTMLQYTRLVDDGDGVNDDTGVYGLGINNHACRLAVTTWDLDLTVKNSEGVHGLNLPNEKVTDAYAKLYSLVYENQNSVHFTKDGKDNTAMFANDQFMFYIETFHNTEQMRDMTSEYGILPYPKYDENQTDYISAGRDAVSAYIVMSDIQNTEMVGALTEAMCIRGRELITPAYYETTLKYRCFSDPVAMGILDKIRDTMTYDFAAVYVYSLEYITTFMGDNIEAGTSGVSGIIRANGPLWTTAIENIYIEYAKVK